jgi:type I restriction enzyme R subunit
MPIPLNEASVEAQLLAHLQALGYAVAHGPEIAPGEPGAERADYGQAILVGRLRRAIARLNPHLPENVQADALRQALAAPTPSLVANNRAMHRLLIDGVPVQYPQRDGRAVGAQVRLIDWSRPANNDWLAVNQFTVEERPRPGEPPCRRRADVVLFVNGLPLAVVELKNPLDENATLWTAYAQLQTYKREIPSLFRSNELLMISDGLQARVGALTADRDWFLHWRTIDGAREEPGHLPEMQVLTLGLFEPGRLLDYMRYCVVFEEDSHGQLVKKVAGYHQFHASRLAVEQTVRASRPRGDRRIGVVWHTQGSGKSLTMAFYAGRIIQHPEMENPTLVVITDRNDLDGQLYGTFCGCRDLLRQDPVQAASRSQLRQLLNVASGGVVFTTIQKFFPDQVGDTHPCLSQRRNIVVIADEAHRSQYDFIDGFARHLRDALPNASFIGFTGTPVELGDKNTAAVFGDYISIYDIQQAVVDGATVPIYYESRLARLELDERERPHLDEAFDEITETEEIEERERLKTKWAALEALVGTESRIERLAQDLVAHWERRLEVMNGKAMIVCMSRRICVALYQALVRLRPEWHGANDEEGRLKIVMTGSASDSEEWQRHIRNQPRRERLANRFKDPADPFQIVIVRDMWLTGFDAPCLHTMYIDKPMQGHGLMQAIARVNRVFGDKPGGLVVDYLGLAGQLRQALNTYTQSGGRGATAIDQRAAIEAMLEKHQIACDMLHGLDWRQRLARGEGLAVLATALDHLLALEDGRERWLAVLSDLNKAFALAVPSDEALAIRDDVAFFQHIGTALSKRADSDLETTRHAEATALALRQLISRAVSAGEVVDIFDAAGLKRPEIGILSEEFLAEVRALPYKNLAADTLRRLLQDDIKARQRRNVVQARRFSEMLEQAIKAYTNRAITTVEFVEELIRLAQEMREADRRGEATGLSTEELAFYDALATNDSAVQVLGDEVLRQIALDLVATVRRSVTIDWTQRESVRAKLRVAIKRVLRRHHYPPDKQEEATRTVLEQAEVLCAEWAA